jgi:SAM-dependent methyltransferase
MTELHRGFSYPLNVFAHVLTLEGVPVDALHYPLFESLSEPFAPAQDRSTALILERLPPPPARLLDVGAGLGALLARVTAMGYDAEGVGPNAAQLAVLRARYGDRLKVHCTPCETFGPTDRPFDVLVFQESSQYIDSDVLFANAARLTRCVLVLDEFAVQSVSSGSLHSLAGFLAAAASAGFRLVEDVDLSRQAAPTVDYFVTRLPRHRDALVRDLGLSDDSLNDLLQSGHRYRDFHRSGVYGHRLLDLRKSG